MAQNYDYYQAMDDDDAWRRYLADDRRARERPPPVSHYENGVYYSHDQLQRFFNSHHYEDPRMAPSTSFNTGHDYFPPYQLQSNQSRDWREGLGKSTSAGKNGQSDDSQVSNHTFSSNIFDGDSESDSDTIMNDNDEQDSDESNMETINQDEIPRAQSLKPSTSFPKVKVRIPVCRKNSKGKVKGASRIRRGAISREDLQSILDKNTKSLGRGIVDYINKLHNKEVNSAAGLLDRLEVLENRAPTVQLPRIVTLSESVSSEPCEAKPLLAALHNKLPGISRCAILNSGNEEVSHTFNYDSNELDGYWQIPKPVKLAMQNEDNAETIGVFPASFKPPTQSQSWDIKSETSTYHDEEKCIKLSKVDSVSGAHKDPEMEAFLSGDPLCTFKRKSSIGETNGYYINLDPIQFKELDVKWEGQPLLSSLEFKNRMGIRPVFSASGLLSEARDRSRSLLVHWDSPSQWSEQGLVVDDRNVAIPNPDGTLLKDSITKEQLADELRTQMRTNELAMLNLSRTEGILRAQNTEIRWELRSQVLGASDLANKELKDRLQFSRFSVKELFGPVPNSLTSRMLNNSYTNKQLSFSRNNRSGGGYRGGPRGVPKKVILPGGRFRPGSSRRGSRGARAINSGTRPQQRIENLSGFSKNSFGGSGPRTKPSGKRGQGNRGRGRGSARGKKTSQSGQR